MKVEELTSDEMTFAELLCIPDHKEHQLLIKLND